MRQRSARSRSPYTTPHSNLDGIAIWMLKHYTLTDKHSFARHVWCDTFSQAATLQHSVLLIQLTTDSGTVMAFKLLHSLQAYSEITDGERQKLVEQEVRGMQHLSALAARPDFHRDMLKDRKLTHPDLLQHCADNVQLPLQPQPLDIASNSLLRRSLSRKLSTGGGSMRRLVQQLSTKHGKMQHVDEDEQMQDELIAVAYQGTIAAESMPAKLA